VSRVLSVRCFSRKIEPIHNLTVECALGFSVVITREAIPGVPRSGNVEGMAGDFAPRRGGRCRSVGLLG